MFNKEESNKIKKIEMKNIQYRKIGYVLITINFLLLLSKFNIGEKDLAKHFAYENEKKAYYERLFDLEQEKEYSELIQDLYHHGKLLINDHDYLINDFYIKCEKDNNKYHLVYINSEYTDFLNKSTDNYIYEDIFKFKDTTAFINLINTSPVSELTIETTKDKLNDIINNWNHKLHHEVPEMDAIINMNGDNDE